MRADRNRRTKHRPNPTDDLPGANQLFGFSTCNDVSDIDHVAIYDCLCHYRHRRAVALDVPVCCLNP